MTDQGEPVDVVYLDFSKAFDSVCHRLLIKKMEAMGIHPKINRWVEKFRNYRTFRVKLGDHNSSAGTVKSWVPQGSVLGPNFFLIFINDLADELACNHLFFADDVKLIASRSQQHELRSSIQQAFTWSRGLDLSLNTSKSHHLSIGGTPDLRIALYVEAEGKTLQNCERRIHPSAYFLAAADYLPAWQMRFFYLSLYYTPKGQKPHRKNTKGSDTEGKGP